jgi:hypothetical protein
MTITKRSGGKRSGGKRSGGKRSGGKRSGCKRSGCKRSGGKRSFNTLPNFLRSNDSILFDDILNDLLILSLIYDKLKEINENKMKPLEEIESMEKFAMNLWHSKFARKHLNKKYITDYNNNTKNKIKALAGYNEIYKRCTKYINSDDVKALKHELIVRILSHIRQLGDKIQKFNTSYNTFTINNIYIETVELSNIVKYIFNFV